MNPEPKFGERLADKVTSGFGSWKYIVLQTAFILTWIILNITGVLGTWDVYPFILLNLALSTQATYAAPLILLSQNRQSAIDQERDQDDLLADLKTEKMIIRIADHLGIDVTDIEE